MSSRSFLYCGSFQGGIYRATVGGGSGQALSAFEKLPDTPESFFLVAHPRLAVLYSLEIRAGRVQAFAIGAEGDLTLLNEVESGGPSPCHLAVDPERRKLVVANYSGGVSLFSILPDGSLSPASFVFEPEGSGPDPKRQDRPHPHGVTLANGLIYVADLGTDLIQALRIERDLLQPEPALDTRVAPGAGPRHFVIHRSGKAAACVNELDNTVTTFLRDPATGGLKIKETRSTLPVGYSAETWTAEIDFHPRHELLIATNRGHDSLAFFSFTPDTAALGEPLVHPAGGGKPQHFVFSPEGEFLFVANTGGNHVALHQINPATGQPELLQTVDVPEPMTLLLR